MRGCLLLVFGIVLGAALVVILEVFVVPPAPAPGTGAATPDLTIQVSDKLLTRELQAQLAQPQAPLTVQNVSVQSSAGASFVVAGTALVPGTSLKVPLRVTLQPSVAQNQVAIQIVQSQVGSLKLPAQLFSSLDDTINRELNRTLANQQYQIVGVRTTADGIVVDVNLKG